VAVWLQPSEANASSAASKWLKARAVAAGWLAADAVNVWQGVAKWREKETRVSWMGKRGRGRGVRGGVAGIAVFTLTCGAIAGGALSPWAAARANEAVPDPSPPSPSVLRTATMEAYGRYVQLTDARSEDEIRSGKVFLWMDGMTEEKRREAYAQLRGGEVVIDRLETLDGGKAIPCPSGIIHHWVAAVFIPGATLERTLALVKDYDHQSIYYAPEVQRSQTYVHKGDDYKIFLRFKRTKVITVVLDTEFDVHYGRVNATQAYSRARSTRIAQVGDPDTPKERELTRAEDGGYMWRMDTYWRFVQQDGGTYVQCEVVSLSRSIPVGVAWIAGPFVKSVPRESLATTMKATRTALVAPQIAH
jgi:hypothetical protein